MGEDFITLISNVGFPIAAYCAMFYMCNTTIKENTKAILDCKAALKMCARDDANVAKSSDTI